MSLVAVCDNQTTVSSKPGGGTRYAGSNGYAAGYGMVYTAVGSTSYPAVKTCEKFQLPNNQWTNLPSMRAARSHFNPCLFGGIVYLCGYNSTIMEAFAPETDTFLPNVQIPVPENCNCCLYVDNDLLVLHQKSCIVKFAAGEGGQLVKRSQVTPPDVSKGQCSQPVVDKARGLYFIIYDGKCVCFNMETGVQGPSV